MSGLTVRRAAFLAAAVACLVYANAFRNGWALDDQGTISENPAAHSVAAAWEARFSPYWPVRDGATAGLYRPAVIMSYAVDWTLSGGRAWWFHVNNVLLHALATALAVLVAAAWLTPAGALAAGLVFAVHPVHVEAVANVAGRSEIMAAVGLLLSVLAFRRYRLAAEGRARTGWLVATVAAVALALLSKEHAVAAAAILALDAWLVRDPARRPVAGPLLAVVAVTVVWLVVWRAVAGGWVQMTTGAALRDLSFGARLDTVFPVYLEVIRLLTWPMKLAANYNPQMIPQRTEFTAVAALGAATAAAMVGLGVASLRRAPAVGFAILAAIATYALTSNLIFVSGTLLGERTLYFAALAPAFTAGWIVQHALGGSRWRRAAPIGLAALLVAFSVRTWTRTPFWRDSRTAMIETLLEYPQNYRAHLQFGRHLDLRGRSAGALAEYLIAGALFEQDPFVAVRSAPVALFLGRGELALAEAERAWGLRPGHPAITGLLVSALQATGLEDSALAMARRGVELAPLGYTPAVIYREALRTRGASQWQLALAEARVSWRVGHLATATAALDSAAAWLYPEGGLEGLCWELAELAPVIATLRPALLDRALEVAEEAGIHCEGGLLRQAGGLAN